MALGQGRAYGVMAGNVAFQEGDFHVCSVGSIAANAAGTQAAGTPITTQIAEVASATSGYSVQLPPSSPGLVITVILTTNATTCVVYPALGNGDQINALTAGTGGITMAARTRAQFCCSSTGHWYTLPLLPS